MWLYTSFDLLQSPNGASAAAYARLRQAGHDANIIYVPSKDRQETLMRLTGQTRLPVVITDGGEVVAPGEFERGIGPSPGDAAADAGA